MSCVRNTSVCKRSHPSDTQSMAVFSQSSLHGQVLRIRPQADPWPTGWQPSKPPEAQKTALTAFLSVLGGGLAESEAVGSPVTHELDPWRGRSTPVSGFRPSNSTSSRRMVEPQKRRGGALATAERPDGGTRVARGRHLVILSRRSTPMDMARDGGFGVRGHPPARGFCKTKTHLPPPRRPRKLLPGDPAKCGVTTKPPRQALLQAATGLGRPQAATAPRRATGPRPETRLPPPP